MTSPTRPAGPAGAGRACPPPRPPDTRRPPAFSYPEVGATAPSEGLPSGYAHLRHRTFVGRGRDVFDAAGAAVTTWRMHRESGARVHAEAERAAPGARLRVAVGVGRLEYAVPCEVVWAAYGGTRTGFAYGTLEGHPESGEESFVVTLDPDGSVWFTVTAFSRPARWYTRAAGPVVPALQRWYARRLGCAVRRLAKNR
ncbi:MULTISPECIES: DUF1990 family protein [unclassified Streptomyces]|uniref:DUF1990 family protein n=1 Tax=unclassified Streptomyces TaxID=2593676 RepID=UPI0009A0B274|nr:MULTISPECIES: DUF1990 domain-containing protein [unclassified Streptomyces]